MKIFRLLFFGLFVCLVGCEESVEEKPVLMVNAEPLIEANSVIEVSEIETKELETSSDEVELLNNACYSNEMYIKEEEICTLKVECKDYASCIEWGNQVIAQLEANYGSLVYEESVATGNEGITILTTYDVDYQKEVLYTDQLIANSDLEYHSNLWFSFSWLIPEENRKEINRFVVFESGDTLAYVSLHDKFGRFWTLGINNKTIELVSEMLITYLHEYAHYLSLNQTQIDYWVNENRCKSIYLKDSGCLYENAYLNKFYSQFWEQSGHGDVKDFFVSKYAMISPEEDFSESFAHFVLTQTPEADSVMEEKVLFFYQYEELVQLRTEILSRIATWLVRSNQ